VLDTITVRQVPFEFPDEVEPDFIDGDHAQSFGLIAGSLLLPVGSQYRSVPELLNFSFRQTMDQRSMIVRIQTKNQSRSRQ
jgi:hypothetical protein